MLQVSSAGAKYLGALGGMCGNAPQENTIFPSAGSTSIAPGRGEGVQGVPKLLLGAVSGTSSTRSAVCSGDASLVLPGHRMGKRMRKGRCAAHIPEDGVGAQHCALHTPGRWGVEGRTTGTPGWAKRWVPPKRAAAHTWRTSCCQGMHPGPFWEVGPQCGQAETLNSSLGSG